MDQYSQLRRFGVFDAKVPRYTSYPPAPRFAGGVNSGDYGRWLSEIPAGSAVSIYLHIPFCKRLCWFCSARTQGAPDGSPVAAYVEALLDEIRLLRAALPQGVWAESVVWGGGTPTILGPDDITRLGAALAQAFPLADTSDITVEIDPNELDDPRMDALAKMGMTHASIGVQDFDPEIQKLIGRTLSFDATKAAVDGLRDRGIRSLSASVLFGLPRQTHAKLAITTQMLLSLTPDRVVVQPYAHAPAVVRRQALVPSDEIPSPEGQASLFNMAAEVLSWDGYLPVGIDHFVRPNDPLARAANAGDLRRGFQGYSDRGEIVLGLGASAISKLPQGYIQNAPGTAAYLQAVNAGGLATKGGHRLSEDDKLRGRMIEMLLCDFRIDTGALLSEGLGTQRRITELLDRLLRHFTGLVTATDAGVVIPLHARPLARVIARDLDAYTPQEHGRGPQS